MIRLELIQLSNDIIKYKYYPEQSTEYGIVGYDRKNNQPLIEKVVENYGRWYAIHAIPYLESCQKTGKFDPNKIIAWY